MWHLSNQARKTALTTAFALPAMCACAAVGASAADPTHMTFNLLATRRYMLDNELVISEFVPGAVVRPSLQNAPMPRGEIISPKTVYRDGAVAFEAPDSSSAVGTLFVGAYYPGVHFSADVSSVSPCAAALLEIAPYDRSLRLTMRAEPGRTVEFTEASASGALAATMKSAQKVPSPPFRLSMVTAGPTVLLAARKDGVVTLLGSVTLADEPDIRRRDLAGRLKCAVGADLPPGGRVVVERAAVSLTAGVGQADFRIVTDGPGCRPYMENGRLFCTFSARAGMKYTKSVASFSPATFDFRMEGILLTNYGDLFCVWFDGACGEGPNGKKQYYDWEQLIAEDQADVYEYNHSLHPNQKKYKGMTRWDVLTQCMNPTLKPYNKAMLARYIGEKVETSIRRNSYCRVMYEDWWLSSPQILAKLAPNDYKVTAYYLTDKDGNITDTYIWQNDQYVDKLVNKGRFNEAAAERTDKDDEIRAEQMKYITQFDKMVKEEGIAKVGVMKKAAIEEHDEVEIIDTTFHADAIAPADEDEDDFTQYTASRDAIDSI